MSTWCERGGREIEPPFEVKSSFDRDGDHPRDITCSCTAEVTPIFHTQHGRKWFWPAHERPDQPIDALVEHMSVEDMMNARAKLSEWFGEGIWEEGGPWGWTGDMIGAAALCMTKMKREMLERVE